MAQTTYPGVYIQEIPSGFRAISGVSTSIAAFVGMAKRGPLLEPTRVLGFSSYAAKFSADTSQGEMTEQLRQFFINGGEQAFIVRVAEGAQEATLDLRNAANAIVLALESIDAGLDANQIRARVDYNTASPERTFNATFYRETFDASGQPVVSALETHTGLGMDPDGARYAEAIINQQSQLVRATVNVANVNAAATLNAFSASATIFANQAAVEAAVTTAIANAGSTVGRFRIKVGDAPWLTVELASAGFAFANIADRINTMLAPFTTVQVTTPVPADTPLRIEADTPGNDVLIERSTELDIAQELGLGVAQGGIEVGTFAAARPVPSSLVSVLDAGAAGDLAALLDFGDAVKANFDTPGVAVVRAFTVPQADIAYPSAAGNMNQGTTAGLSLRNIRENLQAIANALSAGSDDWRAEVHGHRLALIPEFGDASSGIGATFTSANPDLSAANQIFDIAAGIIGASAAGSLQGGSDGNVPQGPEYDAAYQQLDEKVDLFNLLILPKSADDTGDPSIRSTLWGAASSFCRDRRAFLIEDLEPVLQTPDGVLAELPDARTGVVKDHTGIWWPQVIIASNGTRKNIDPSGSIAGLMARIDGSRGVWKAPAGLEASILGVLGVRVPMSDQQNGLINPEAINAVRAFPAGVVSWGARTLDGFDNSGNTDYRYVPVRRFALFIEESLVRGLKFAVFEPNDEPLWAQIRLAAGAFMNSLFRRGAFAGRTSREAYFVKADAETTTPQDQALGVVNVLVGFAPLRPAEFIVITIQQLAGQVQV
ncbi:MAG: phage tail sheath C-terminal domain-containing protein [Bryobacteraceae bacterium]